MNKTNYANTTLPNPRDGVVNDHFAEWRSASRMSDATFTVANSSSGRGSRSRSKVIITPSSLSSLSSSLSSLSPNPQSPGLVSVPGNPGLFSKATVSSRARQRASVDYTFGQVGGAVIKLKLMSWWKKWTKKGK